MVVVRFPVVLLIYVVVQVLAECVIDEFPPFAIIDILALSSKVLRVKCMIHEVSSQDVEALSRVIQISHYKDDKDYEMCRGFTTSFHVIN